MVSFATLVFAWLRRTGGEGRLRSTAAGREDSNRQGREIRAGRRAGSQGPLPEVCFQSLVLGLQPALRGVHPLPVERVGGTQAAGDLVHDLRPVGSGFPGLLFAGAGHGPRRARGREKEEPAGEGRLPRYIWPCFPSSSPRHAPGAARREPASGSLAQPRRGGARASGARCIATRTPAESRRGSGCWWGGGVFKDRSRAHARPRCSGCGLGCVAGARQLRR